MLDAVNSNSLFMPDNDSVNKLKAAVFDFMKSEKGRGAMSYNNKVFNKIDRFLDLGSTFNIGMRDLTDTEKEQFLTILAKLLKKGIVGYNYYEINGRVEKHFITASIGNRRLYGQKILRNSEARRSGVYV